MNSTFLLQPTLALGASLATEDGGVIGKSGIIYDQNGAATGQMTGGSTYTWLGNSYRVGSVLQLQANIILLADTFWAFQGGNASSSGAMKIAASSHYVQPRW